MLASKLHMLCFCELFATCSLGQLWALAAYYHVGGELTMRFCVSRLSFSLLVFFVAFRSSSAFQYHTKPMASGPASAVPQVSKLCLGWKDIAPWHATEPARVLMPLPFHVSDLPTAALPSILQELSQDAAITGEFNLPRKNQNDAGAKKLEARAPLADPATCPQPLTNGALSVAAILWQLCFGTAPLRHGRGNRGSLSFRPCHSMPAWPPTCATSP